MFELLRRLCETAAPSGCESRLHDLIIEEIRPFVDDIRTDVLGNIIAHRAGPGKKLMFAAHMDEIGVIATCHGKEGRIYFSALGGVSPYAALYQRVSFTGGAQGVVALDGKAGDLLKDLKLQNLYIDIGAKSEEEAAELVSIGEAGSFSGAFSTLGDCLVSKALDDRAGCYVLMEAMKKMKTHQNDLYFVFTAGEELGLRGAKAAAATVQPNYAVAIDVTRTGDVPGADNMAVRLGKGVAVKVMDQSFIAHPTVKDTMTALCRTHNIPFQLEVLERGGTDAGAIHLTGGGVPSGCISIPARFIHTPGEMIHKDDLENAVRLAMALIEEGLS